MSSALWLRRASVLTMAASLTAASVVTSGQTPDARPTFDTVSVKPNASGSGPVFMRNQPGGLFTAANTTVLGLLQNAYGTLQGGTTLDAFRIVGAPAWASSDRFDISAKASGTSSREQIELMLQSLLVDRFKLVAHRETRDLPIYLLVPTRSDGTRGPQLRPGDTSCQDGPVAAGQPRPIPCAPEFGPPGRIAARAIPMSLLARNLSARVNRDVRDNTGLTGVFAVDVQWTPDSSEGLGPLGPPPPAVTAAAQPDSAGVSLFTALREQLGLELRPSRGPVEVMVIDHVERPTAD